MTNITIFISAFLGAAVLMSLSAIAAYWQERGEGHTHAISLNGSTIIVGLLLSNAFIGYTVNVAHYH